MRKYAIPLLICFLLGMAATAAQAQGGGNLLANPSFEGAYSQQDGKGTIIVADKWRGYWKDGGSLPDWAQQGAGTTPIRQPEYKAGTLAVDYRRVRTGNSSQVLFTYYGIMLAGVQQSVIVERGASYQAGAFVQAWTSQTDDPCKTEGQMVALVGVDPYGGTDPWSRQVAWGRWHDANPGCNKWNEVRSPVVVAEGEKVTVYVFFQHRWSFEHGDGYVEDAWLEKVARATEPCPTPEPCPACPECPPPGPSGDCLTKAEYDAGQGWLVAQVEALLRRLQLVLQ